MAGQVHHTNAFPPFYFMSSQQRQQGQQISNDGSSQADADGKMTDDAHLAFEPHSIRGAGNHKTEHAATRSAQPQATDLGPEDFIMFDAVTDDDDKAPTPPGSGATNTAMPGHKTRTQREKKARNRHEAAVKKEWVAAKRKELDAAMAAEAGTAGKGVISKKEKERMKTEKERIRTEKKKIRRGNRRVNQLANLLSGMAFMTKREEEEEEEAEGGGGK